MLEIIKKISFWIKNGLIIACWRFQNLPLVELVHFAVETEGVDLLSWCIQNGADINMRYADGRTLIHQAVKKRSHKIVHFLLENGADPNKVDNDGISPLQLSVLYQYESILDALLDHENVNPNIFSNETPQPIVIAYQKNNFRMINSLIIRGARMPDEVASTGPTHFDHRLAAG